MNEVYKAVVVLIEAGGSGALATVVDKEGSGPQVPGAKMLVRLDGSIVGTVGGGMPEQRAREAAAEVIRTGQPQTVTVNLGGAPRDEDGICGGRLILFIEPIASPAPLLIFGAGHVGQALAKLAVDLGFRVTVVDERPEFARLERLPGAHEVKLGVGPDIAEQLPVDERTFMVIVTHGHKHDREILRWAAGTNARYVGMMASRSKVTAIVEQLVADGIPAEQLDRVHAPIGLNIGAVDPAEIAVSIAAELIRERRGPKGPLTEGRWPCPAGE